MTEHERQEYEQAKRNHDLFHDMMDKRVSIPKLGSLDNIKAFVNSWPDAKPSNNANVDLPDCIVELQNLIKSLKKPT